MVSNGDGSVDRTVFLIKFSPEVSVTLYTHVRVVFYQW